MGKGFIWNPYHVSSLLEQAGFVDIQVKKVEIKLGKWWVEGFTLSIRPNIDPRLYAAAQDAIDVLAGVVEPLVDSMKMYWEDDQERATFVSSLGGIWQMSPIICTRQCTYTCCVADSKDMCDRAET